MYVYSAYNDIENKLITYNTDLREFTIINNVGSGLSNSNLLENTQKISNPLFPYLVYPDGTREFGVMKLCKSNRNNILFSYSYNNINHLMKIDIINNVILFDKIETFGHILDFEIGKNDDEILATVGSGIQLGNSFNSNYDNIYYTIDGGTNWISKHKENYGLPNFPVYAAIFNPNNPKQVLIGTELGVWGTNDITLNNPKWELANTELANVKCVKFKYRESDKMFFVGTYGRGIFSSNIFDNTMQCASSLFLPNSNSNLNETGSFTSSDSIVSTSKIYGSFNNVKYYSKKINLLPGFKVSKGASFTTFLEPCDQNAARKGVVETPPIVVEQKEDILEIYPNPVENKEFTIDYTVSNTGNINLYLSSLEGRNIKNILKEKYHKPGTYEINVKVNDLGEGLYLCILTGNDLFQAKKILIK